ncbi:sodium:solute symporter family protein [Novosphingobium sp. Leaf2]|uniref:sodium:solute symporter family protein n=1 Tax=Novosphingobium sp. Leaf2 TaxID=1735670 RepID=UPI0006F41038|nr:sodium:solute symporter family protein [Novosphingobium sp. Leaf2]KQM18346.1 sodium:solute symporter [Novosphingobium sp. Leaf2]
MILTIILLIVGGTVAGSMLYGRRRQQAARNMEEWALGGRKLGTLVFWFLNAGEIYTTFAVLGISGFAWAYGAPAYLAFCSVSLAAAVGYWLTPLIHAYGRRHGLVTQADFFAHRYQAPWLGICVAVAGLVALVVYVQIQVTALTLVVRLAAGPAVSQEAAAFVSVVSMLLFVFLAGLRSAAFAAGVKDVLMLIVVIVLAWTVAGLVGEASVLDVFHGVAQRFPEATRFPGLKPALGLDVTWLVTSAINVALGTYIFPHMFQLCYSAGSGDTIRRNAVLQPIYSLSYFFIILLGFAALLAGTAAPGGDPNALLLAFVGQRYPAWVLGLLAGTASLLALVPGSVLLLTCGSIFGRNVLRPLFPAMDDRRELLASRLAMIGFAAIALYLTLGASGSLVEVGLSAYAAIGMLAPGVYCAFLLRRTQPWAILAGLVTGYAILWVPALTAAAAALFVHWEIGLVALLANALVAVSLTLLIPARATPLRAS